jgi:hypothetical protein
VIPRGSRGFLCRHGVCLTEAVKVFAVLGLLGLVLVLFIGLMLVLNALSVF